MTFSRSLSKFIFISKGGIAVCKRCASKTFSFRQSLSLCSVLQHELRHGHQLSLSAWAEFRLEPSFFSSQPRLIPSLSVAAQHRQAWAILRHLKVRMVNGVFRHKGELESSAIAWWYKCASWGPVQMEWRRDIHVGRTREQNVLMVMWQQTWIGAWMCARGGVRGCGTGQLCGSRCESCRHGM